MAESIVNFAVETIGKMLIDEAIFLSGVSKQVEQLRLELSRLQAFLKDADARQNDNEMIKVRVSQSRDLAYEAEDLIEDYAYKIESRKGNILKRSVRILNECVLRHSIGVEIQTLRSKIADLTKTFHDHGVANEGSSSLSSVQQLRRTYSQIAEDEFIGMEEEMEMLVGHLVNESGTRFKVVSIHGMGGSGKTTIARKVYNDPKVKRYFTNYAWVCVSQQWQTKDILQGILIKLIPSQREEIQKWRDEELVRKLHQILQDNRYLIVLDDVWSADAWNCLKEAFPIRAEGSKILVTTRIKDVATQIGPTGFHHELRLLNEQESWELLRIKAFRRGEGQQGPQDMHKMEELGKELVRHCGGLPLAVIVLGGILFTKRDLNEWHSISKHVKSYLGRGNNNSQQREVEKILGLSYNDLPLKLKPCFLYLGRYPEDSEIETEKLYQLWLAEGIVSMKDLIGDESTMNIAESYLAGLAQRSLVRVEVSETPGFSRFRSCRLHDLVRDLSLRKAKEENFFLLVHSQNGFFDNSSTGQIHRIVIHFDVAQYLPPPKRVTRHLRSLKLLVQNEDAYRGVRMLRTFKSQLNWSRMLRVLEFEGFILDPETDMEFICGILNHRKLSNAIGNLIHLRYLSLRGSQFLWFTSSLGNLRHLHTIDLRDIWELRMSNVIWKMRQLRHLYLPNRDRMDWLGMPFGNKLRLEGLNKLEILERFDDKWCSTEDLLKLTNLRQLHATLHFKHSDIVEIASFIANSNNMCHAALCVYFPSNDSPIIRENCSTAVAKLFSCRNLLQLYMSGHIGNVPKYEAGFASDLYSLTLRRSQLQEDPLETLGMLPNLRNLSLSNCFRGTEMKCRAMGFPQLRTLVLEDLPNLLKWTVAEGSMPNLSSLTIDDCNKLEMIPDGLRFVAALKELNIIDMPSEFERRIQVIDGEEGEDFYKIRHVPLVKVD